MRKWKYYANTGIISYALLSAGSSFAQDAMEEGEKLGAGQAEIIVTAQKRAENVQKVPITVDVMGGANIEQKAITGLAEVASYLPAIKVSESATGDQLFIRGVGSGVNPGFEQSVGTFIDGVYYGRGRQSTGTISDVERIEVLKGPQSLYFGNSTIAGAISIATRSPGSQVAGYAQASHEFRFNGNDLQAAIDLPLSERFAMRLSGRYAHKDGYLRNTYLDRDDVEHESWVLRNVMELYATDTTKIRLKLQAAKIHEDGNPYQIVKCPGVLGAEATPTCSAALANAETTGFEDSFDRNKQDGLIGPAPSPYFETDNMVRRQNSQDAVLTIEQDLPGDHLLTSVTAFTRYEEYRNSLDADFTPTPILMVPRRERNEQFSQELRVQSPDGELLEYVAGLYYQHGDFALLDRFVLSPGGGSITRTAHDETSETFSGFAALTLNPTDTLSLTLGLRYSDVTKDAIHGVTLLALDEETPLSDAGRTFLANNVGFFESEPFAAKRSDSDLVPSVNLRWEAAPNINFYASYTEGFKSGGFDGLLRSDPDNADYLSDFEFSKETVKAYEFGVKSTLLDGAARLNLALFRSDYDDLQVSTFDGRGGFKVGNAGKARTQGVEFNGQIYLSDQIEIHAATTYLDTEYRSFDTAQCRVDGPRPNPDIPGTCDLTGERLPYAPKWSGSFGASMSSELSSDLEIFASSDMTYSSSYYTASDNDPNTEQSSYSKVDAAIGLRSIDKRWSVSLVGTNLTDKHTISQANDTPLGRGSYFVLLEQPRAVSLQLRTDF